MFTAPRYHPAAQPHAQDKQDGCGEGVRDHQTMVTDTCGVHGDDLRVAGQFGGKEDDRNEDEQRAEHVHVVRKEGQVVLEDDLLERNLVLKEIVHFLREVEDDRDRQNQHDREKERTQEFLYYVPIEAFH